MLIRVIKKYKSLKPFTSEELNDFVVITGKNGSGKSQLVQLIQQVNLNNEFSNSIYLEPKQNNIQIEGIAFGYVQPLNAKTIIDHNNRYFGAFKGIHDEIKKFIGELLNNGLDPHEISERLNILKYMNDDSLENKKRKVVDIANRNFSSSNHHYDSNIEERYLHGRNILINELKARKGIINIGVEVCNYKNKTFAELQRNDFNSTPLTELFYTEKTTFSVEIEKLFYGYAKRRMINELEFVRRINYQKNNSSLPDDEFIRKFPPPWEIINTILEKHKLKLRINNIPPEDFSTDYDFEATLIDTITSEYIKFEDLSSGEKIIVGLIIRLFLTDTYKNELVFPNLIVLDEPDAYLHPQMSSLLLEVLYETFVKRFGIKVIITTHDPSTVALTPEDSIYELKNGEATELKKVSKDDALKMLTDKLPLLSIDYKNHRQVFVESPTDEYYYQNIFNKLKSDNKNLFDLYFITIGYGKGNCNQVIELTNHLRSAGNKTSFGIIDWDKVNSDKEYVYVHGFEKRYSIENFIYDPVYLLILFCEQNCSNNISEIGLDKTYNQYNLPLENTSRIQDVIQWFFTKINARFPTFRYEQLIEVSYTNGKVLQIPDWYLTIQGHELEVKLRETFPSLDAFKGTGNLEKRLTELQVNVIHLYLKKLITF